jgi:polyisoprenoid-binding protein YceI
MSTFQRLFLLLSLVVSAAKAGDLAVTQGHVDFEAVGRPSMLKITGQSDAGMQGTLQMVGGAITGKCAFTLETLSTGIGMRDDHMKHRYLETQKFPEATVAFTQFAVGASGGKAIPFQGELTLHGEKKPISGSADVDTAGGKLAIDARFEITLSDFGISQPSFSGITIAKIVKIHAVAIAPMK